ncbi:MAG: GH25 family lysozyme [Hungatella sp.]
MKIRRWLAACLTGSMILGTAVTTAAAEPWSMVDGKFIAADGKPMEGALAKGVTISKYQNHAGMINWKKVSADYISFAMIRLGDINDKDPYFDENMRNVAAHRLKSGVLFYAQALTKKKAVEEARYVLEIVKDYDVSYPIAYDVESQKLLDKGRTKQQITDQVNSFCNTIAEAGYCPVVYGSYEWLTQNIDTQQIPYGIWYARYGVGNKYPNRTLWQCTDSGKVSGIPGLVCLEFAFTDYEQAFPGTGWRHINDFWYYYDNYKMVRATTLNIDHKDYNFGPNGVCLNRMIKKNK